MEPIPNRMGMARQSTLRTKQRSPNQNQRDNIKYLYDTLVDELKGTISRFQAQYNIQEINPYLQDILQNPEDLVSLSQPNKR